MKLLFSTLELKQKTWLYYHLKKSAILAKNTLVQGCPGGQCRL